MDSPTPMHVRAAQTGSVKYLKSRGHEVEKGLEWEFESEEVGGGG